MNPEQFKSTEALSNEVAQLGREIDAQGVDTAELEEVVKIAHLLFGEGYPEADVSHIIETFYAKEQAAATQADEMADAA